MGRKGAARGSELGDGRHGGGIITPARAIQDANRASLMDWSPLVGARNPTPLAGGNGRPAGSTPCILRRKFDLSASQRAGLLLLGRASFVCSRARAQSSCGRARARHWPQSNDSAANSTRLDSFGQTLSGWPASEWPLRVGNLIGQPARRRLHSATSSLRLSNANRAGRPKECGFCQEGARTRLGQIQKSVRPGSLASGAPDSRQARRANKPAPVRQRADSGPTLFFVARPEVRARPRVEMCVCCAFDVV